MSEQFKPVKVGEVSAEGKFTPVTRDDLGTLRPEVRDAIDRAERMAACPADDATIRFIRAELVRFSSENTTLERSNLRLREKVDSLRSIANVNGDWTLKYSQMRERAEKAEAELAALKARIANSCRADGQRVFDLLGLPIEFDGALALVKVEE